jgi:hypothetical protein
MQLKAVRFAFVLALLVWSGAVFSIEANHRMMKGLSTQFSTPLALPTKYFSFTREMSRLDTETAILKETWDVELAGNPNGNHVVFLPPVYAGKYEYIEISATTSATNGKWENVPIGYKTFEIEDENQTRIAVKSAFLKIAKTHSTSRLKVSFSTKGTIADGLEQYGLNIALPPETPVKEARLILMRELQDQDDVQVELSGFTERFMTGKRGRLREYVLSKEWLGANLSNGVSAPKVAVSYSRWATIAAKHARFYKTELARNDVDLLKVDPAIQGIVANRALSKVEKAYQLFKWIGQYLTYVPGRLTFKLEEKYTPSAINDTLTKRTGNCLDYTLLYLKLLSIAGIHAEPVEVNLDPGGNGAMYGNGASQLKTTVPSEHTFSHVIVYIPELNIYVDPTDSSQTQRHPSFTLFGIASAAFSNVYGLNLFSGKLVQINVEQVQSRVSVSTTYSKVEGQWIGKTTRRGSGLAYRTISLGEHQRNLRKERGQKLDRLFTESKTSLIADSWKFEGDDIAGRATQSFAFVLSAELLDANGRMTYLPDNLMTGAVLLYEFVSHLDNPELCFGSEASEETIELTGQFGFSIHPDLQEVKLSGVNSNFSQNISISETGLKLHRTFVLNEKRGTCSAGEIEAQRKFYASVRNLKAKTHAATSLRNAK